MDSHKRNSFFYLLLILVAVCIAYANHFYNEFHFDDFHSIVNNSYIRNLHHIPQYFIDPKMFSTDPTKWGLRPLVTTTLAIDYWMGQGLNPFYFQLSTFIWYLTLCIFLYLVYRILYKKSHLPFRPEYPALLTTAWYALHKANAETVNYIIARTDVISTVCIVASFLIFIAWPHRRKYLLYVIPAFLGVFAKETVPVLIILLFFYLILFEKQMSLAALFKPKNFKNALLSIWQIMPLIVVVVATQVYTLSRISSIPGISNPLLHYVLTQSFVWVHYVIEFFLPMNLSADTDWTVITNVFDERIVIGMIFIVAMVVFIFKTSSKMETKPVAFGLIWFSASLLPTSLAPFAEVTNDHRMFFAFIGLALSVVAYIHYLLMRYQQHGSSSKQYITVVYTALLLVIVLNAKGANNRNKVWATEESLWYDVTVKSPLNGRGMMNYGVVEMGKGNYTVADRYFTSAKALLPTYSTLYLNIGVLKNALHDPQQAEENFKQAIQLDLVNFQNYEFYARFLTQNNRFSEAKPIAEDAVKLNPTSISSLQLLMSIDAKLQLWRQLQTAAKQDLAIWPADTTAQSYFKTANEKLHL